MIKYFGMKEEFPEENKKVVAKEVVVESTGEKRFYIRSYKGQYIDPDSTDFFRVKEEDTKWIKVSEDTYIKYKRFLSSGLKRWLSYARRGI